LPDVGGNALLSLDLLFLQRPALCLLIKFESLCFCVMTGEFNPVAVA